VEISGQLQGRVTLVPVPNADTHTYSPKSSHCRDNFNMNVIKTVARGSEFLYYFCEYYLLKNGAVSVSWFERCSPINNNILQYLGNFDGVK
jgi:hypothetical protein